MTCAVQQPGTTRKVTDIGGIDADRCTKTFLRACPRGSRLRMRRRCPAPSSKTPSWTPSGPDQLLARTRPSHPHRGWLACPTPSIRNLSSTQTWSGMVETSNLFLLPTRSPKSLVRPIWSMWVCPLRLVWVIYHCTGISYLITSHKIYFNYQHLSRLWSYHSKPCHKYLNKL